MRSLVVAALLTLGAVFLLSPGHAARNLEPVAASAAGQELVVFEARPCAYCDLFRRNVLPEYQRSRHAAALPIRFVDINQADISRLPLAAPISVLPTVVMLRNGREAGRISGYTGFETFLRLVSLMLGER
jgi:hypothetical protein